MIAWTFPPLILAGCTNATDISAERFEETGEMVAMSGGNAGAANACFTCHGLDGGGDGAGTPRLAGLDPGYLDRQLQSFADGRRRHPRMEWIASRLGPSDRLAVSNFYHAMAFRPGQPKPGGDVPALYIAGDARRGLPSCASCHGLDGAGVGLGNPPLAGQPAPYLAAQLHAWRDSSRRSDPGNMMLTISQRLTPAEVEALAAYAARLPGDPPGPESPEASRAAHRDDPRNDASGMPRRAPGPGRAGR